MLSLTVGIAAYNEASNISHLLHEITVQSARSYSLERIVTVSDGSTDETPNIISDLQKKIPRLYVVTLCERKGKSHAQNIIMQKSSSDLLLLLDADVALPHKTFIDSFVNHIQSTRSALSSAHVQAAPARSLIARSLATSMDIKYAVFTQWKEGDNIYTCHGRARMLTRELYTKLRFPSVVAEDAYSYLFCKHKNLRYSYASCIRVIYQLPTTFRDHYRQSQRYFRTITENEKYFDKEFVRAQYRYPPHLFAKHTFLFFIKRPIEVCVYMGIVVTVVVFQLFDRVCTVLWKISHSTKRITRHLDA
jgi:glycosyltransferase involved in cell wall biosynthesis